MKNALRITIAAAALAFAASASWAKLPPPPPVDPAVKAAADEKKAAAAAAAKAELAAAQEKAIKNYQANMKKAGKPVPKSIPLAKFTIQSGLTRLACLQSIVVET